jgi:hypothetical protein
MLAKSVLKLTHVCSGRGATAPFATRFGEHASGEHEVVRNIHNLPSGVGVVGGGGNIIFDLVDESFDRLVGIVAGREALGGVISSD